MRRKPYEDLEDRCPKLKLDIKKFCFVPLKFDGRRVISVIMSDRQSEERSVRRQHINGI